MKAVDHCTGRTLAWVLGGRDAVTFQRLYDKVKHLKDCLFYTDNWDAFGHCSTDSGSYVSPACLVERLSSLLPTLSSRFAEHVQGNPTL